MKIKDANQFIEVEFKEPVYVTGIDIYETYHAGGVKAIKALGDDGKWHTLWKIDRVTVIKSSRIFSPQLAELSCRTKNIRVEVDCTGCGTWVEIDAIQLHGRTFLIEPPPPLEDLATDLGQMVNDSKFSDCQFLLEGKHTVYAHKVIICARSDYFRAMFSEKTKESQSGNAIEIKDVPYKSFLAVIHFLYTNNLPSDLKTKQQYDTITLTDVWRIADRFSMAGLKTLAAYMISIKIDETNVVDTYVAAVDTLPLIGKYTVTISSLHDQYKNR
ncbi:speckle-type POZ protein-like isoform X2 [Mercenaria mercenaria]|uniref:speckle-type POZ protein-like isoform X2 n=1 Tax=Mercenaria mercenaria TaxID=6596 RepID=UPI00234F16A1|nr:speckle-type POZ protein-like isoform X2 [Mercenaria mercenaria]